MDSPILHEKLLLDSETPLYSQLIGIIKRAIIDMNARIGDGCRIGIDDIPRKEGDFGDYSIHDGIIIINKGVTIPNGTVL